MRRRELLVVLSQVALASACKTLAPPPEPKRCADPETLDPQSAAAREGLVYLEVSPYPGKDCAGCIQWVAPDGNLDCGGCRLFTGAVAAGGHCQAFVGRST